MADLIAVFGQILRELWNAIFNQFFLIVVGLVAFQYSRIAKSRERLFGIKGASFLKDTIQATAFGIAGGLVGSILLVLTGIDLTGLGIGYLWPLALLLMLINPRFLCFSYAGGILALSGLLFGFPQISVPHLMGLVAVLHLVESLLIYFSGHLGAMPMFTKKDTGQMVGGFTLQKFWPLPLVAVALLPGAPGYSVLPDMPAWWPMIKLGSGLSLDQAALLLPFIAGLGYGDLALAHTPAEKSRLSARNLSIFSLVLLFLAMLASHYRFFLYLAALFAPLGHELVIYIGKRTELSGEAIFVPPGKGVRILDAIPQTPAAEAGLKTGDILCVVDGVEVNGKRDIEAVMGGKSGLIEMEYISYADRKWQRRTTAVLPYQPLGVVAVPEGYETLYMELNPPGLLTALWKKFKSLLS